MEEVERISRDAIVEHIAFELFGISQDSLNGLLSRVKEKSSHLQGFILACEYCNMWADSTSKEMFVKISEARAIGKSGIAFTPSNYEKEIRRLLEWPNENKKDDGENG